MRGKRITMQVDVGCENCGGVIEVGEVARQWKIGEKWVFAHRMGRCYGAQKNGNESIFFGGGFGADHGTEGSSIDVAGSEVMGNSGGG